MRTKAEILQGENEISFTAKAMLDFLFFAERVIGINIAEYHEQMVNTILKNRYACVLCPRGHSKTYIWSICYSIWRLWKEERIEICLVSSTVDQSKKNMAKIQELIEENEILKELLPENRRDSWNKFELNTKNHNKCFVKPFNATIRGIHVNYLICDDVLRDEDITQEQAKEIFWGVITPTVQTKKGQLIVIGTPMNANDLLSELEHKKGWSWKKFKAVSIDINGKWIKPLWEWNFTLEELRNIKDNMGALKFDREYLCTPMGGGSSIFPEELIKQCLGSFEINKPRPGCMYYLGIDVALSARTGADFTVFTVIEQDANGKMYQRRMDRFKGMRSERIIAHTKHLDSIFNFRMIMPEERGLSKGIVQTMTEDEAIRIKIKGFITTKPMKEAIISHLQANMATNLLKILDNPILIKELGSFGKKIDSSGKETYEGLGEHDDTVISLAIAVHCATECMRGQASISFV